MEFSQRHADAACNFFELVLRHTMDEWYGKPFRLCPWQEDALTYIFGNLDDEGNRVVQLVYLELPKKTGKTEFAAGVLLLCILLDPNPGCQVYGAGAALRQATNVYRAACKMVEQSPLLKKHFRILRSTNRIIKRKDPDSFYGAIAADGDLSDGVNPSVVVADEVHRWRTRKQLENWDVLSLGGITRKQTLTIAITTAGVQAESPLAWRLHEKTLRIRQGVISDPAFYGRIYAASEKDDWTKEKTWIKANPSLIENGGFLPIAKIREQYESSLSDPSSQFAFRRYFLNIWGQAENRVIDMAKWDACGRRGHGQKIQFLPWRAAGLVPQKKGEEIRTLPDRLIEHFQNRTCWAGLDISMTTDLSALSLVFPCEDGGYEILPFIWLPSADLKKREIKDGVPYRLWVKEGFLETSGDAAIDQSAIEARIKWAADLFQLQELCYDPWNSRDLVRRVEAAYGTTCVEIRQGYPTLSLPSKKLLELVKMGKFYHGGHPVLKWHASCLSTREQNDNLMFRKPERNKTSSRIDGIAASVNALCRAMLNEPTGSVYDDRGLLRIGEMA